MNSEIEKIRVVIVDDNAEIAAAIAVRLKPFDNIEVVGTGLNGREALQLANSLHPDVMVLDVQMPLLNGVEAASRIASIFPSIGILILTADESVDTLKAAMKAGVREYLNKMTDLPRIGEAILEANARRDRQAPEKGLGSVWSFYSSKGTSGTTTLAVNVACDLAHLGYRVLLMDFDTLHGDCAFLLNLKDNDPDTSLFSNLESISQLSQETLDTYVRKHSLGPDGPQIEVCESPNVWLPSTDASETAMGAILELAVATYDHIVIDLPPGQMFDSVNALVLDYTERLFMLSNRDVCAIKAMYSFLHVLTRSSFSMKKVTLLFSPLVDHAGFDYKAWLAEKSLGIEHSLSIPADPDACAQALLKGVPILLGQREGTLVEFIHGLVERGLNLPPSQGKKESFWNSFIRMLGG